MNPLPPASVSLPPAHLSPFPPSSCVVGVRRILLFCGPCPAQKSRRIRRSHSRRRTAPESLLVPSHHVHHRRRCGACAAPCGAPCFPPLRPFGNGLKRWFFTPAPPSLPLSVGGPAGPLSTLFERVFPAGARAVWIRAKTGKMGAASGRGNHGDYTGFLGCWLAMGTMVIEWFPGGWAGRCVRRFWTGVLVGGSCLVATCS